MNRKIPTIKQIKWEGVDYKKCIELEKLEKINDAIECYKRAVIYFRRTNQKVEACKSLSKIASLFILKRNFKLAEEYINDAIKCGEELNDKLLIASQFVKLGNLNQASNKLNKALYFYKRALNLIKEYEGDSYESMKLELGIRNNMAVIFMLQGDIEFAKKNFLYIIDLFDNFDFGIKEKKKFLVPALINIGNIHFETGDLTRAEDYLLQAKKWMEALGEENPRRKIYTYLNLTYILVLLNKLFLARKLLKETRKILPDEEKALKVHYLINLGKYYSCYGSVELSMKILLKAKELGQRIGHEYAEGLVYNELGLIYKDQEDLRTSLEYLTRARKFFETLDFYKHKVRSKIDEIENNFISIAIQWGRKVEEKDPYTLGHSARTTYYAFLIGQKVFSSDEIALKGLIIGGFLHDIGKLMIDDKILLKPTRLTPEEFEEIKKHPIYAVDQLKNIEFPWGNVKDCILYHHEKFDGSGYPHGLSGKEIPICARIIAVADVFDALTTDRPYRDPWPWEKALDFIVSLKNMAFDPEIVDIFVEIINELDKSLISTQYTEQMVRELWRFFK